LIYKSRVRKIGSENKVIREKKTKIKNEAIITNKIQISLFISYSQRTLTLLSLHFEYNIFIFCIELFLLKPSTVLSFFLLLFVFFFFAFFSSFKSGQFYFDFSSVIFFSFLFFLFSFLFQKSSFPFLDLT